jgi:hypothetical protein
MNTVDTITTIRRISSGSMKRFSVSVLFTVVSSILHCRPGWTIRPLVDHLSSLGPPHSRLSLPEFRNTSRLPRLDIPPTPPRYPRSRKLIMAGVKPTSSIFSSIRIIPPLSPASRPKKSKVYGQNFLVGLSSHFPLSRQQSIPSLPALSSVPFSKPAQLSSTFFYPTNLVTTSLQTSNRP